VRHFEAEEELPLRVVIDASASMGFYRKLEVGKVLAGMVAYLGLAGGDRVQLVALYGGPKPVTMGPAGRHLSRWPMLESWLEGLSAAGGGELAPSLRRLAGEGPNRGALIVVSDLMSPDYATALDGLGVGAGGVVLHILGDEELDPGLAGDLRLADAETKGEVAVSTSEDTMRRYRLALEAFASEVAGRSRRAGLDYVLVPAREDAAHQVLAALARAEAVA
jgi:uncharacterized protein (DUF58 family)